MLGNWGKYMEEQFISTKTAALILNKSVENVRSQLTAAFQEKNGKIIRNFYSKAKVLALKNRIDTYKKNKKEITTNTKKIKVKHALDSVLHDTTPKQRGRICLYIGCTNPVGTGEAVCQKHKAWYKNRQSSYSYLDDIECKYNN